MFTPIGNLIKALPRRSKTPEAILALHVRQAFSAALNTVCGDLDQVFLKDVRASVFKNGILTVISPALLSAELSMRSGGLTREINRLLGRNIVLRIRYKNN
jgi:hypothetical protein